MISKEEVKHIAKLARLELSEQEIEKMQKELAAILDYFNLLKEAKKPETEQAGKFLDIEKATRKDIALEKEPNLRNRLLELAPDKKEGYVKVKNIF